MSGRQLSLLDPDQRLGPVQIDEKRYRPLLWAERFVYLSHPEPVKVLREVELHRGLNIIRTERRLPGERQCVAHDVGKTLFARLLRYTLGEPWFGDRVTTDRVRSKLPFGHVVAVWYVADASWTVVRPFDDREQACYVIEGKQWQRAFDPNVTRKPLETFMEAINAQMCDQLPSLQLSRDTSAQFADILPWLCRDTQIGLQKCDVWRDKDVNPTKQHSRTTNRLLMKWLMGLVRPPEANSRNLKLNATEQAKLASNACDQMQSRMNSLYESMKETASFEEPQPGESGQPISTADLASKLVEFIRDQHHAASNRRKQLPSMRFERQDAEKAVEAIQGQIEAAIREEEQAKSQKRELAVRLRAEQKLSTAPSDCPGKQDCFWAIEIEANKLAGGSLAESALIRRLEEQQSEADDRIQKATSALTDLQECLRTAQEHATAIRAAYEKESSECQEADVRWQQLSEMAKSLEAAVSEVEQTDHARTMAEDDVTWHNKVIDDSNASDETKQALAKLEHCYAHTLARVYDSFSVGELDLASGLSPGVDTGNSRHGTALSTMQNVLAFDLACLLGSACGIGSHPRLLLHDGAREGEAESELYLSLLKSAEWMQSLFEPEDLPFQYIVTTADAPDEYDDKHPAVVQTLHGRSDDGLLLRRGF